MTPAEVIREARNVLFERGWHQGSLSDDDGSVCTMGAFYVALYGQPRPPTINDDIIPTFNIMREAAGDSVANWNDAPTRTFDEVIDALDRAEKIAEREAAS